MVKKVITNLDSSKASGPDCIPVVVLKNCEPRTARLWNSLPKECFPLTYDLSGFESRINRYLLTVGSF